MTHLFLDTEFTDFIDCDLISIAVVAEDGRAFYAERNDFRQAACSDFVRTDVLPLLGRYPDRVMSEDRLRSELQEWLSQFAQQQPVLCFDFVGDLDLAIYLLGAIPHWLGAANVRHKLDETVRKQWFKDTGLVEHHALYDAQAMRFAYRGAA